MTLIQEEQGDAGVLGIPIVDVDSHLSEPTDLWTSRVAPKWRDQAPRTVRDSSGRDIWMLDDFRLPAVGMFSVAGWPEPPPAYPDRLEDADPAAWQPKARLARMDEYGVQAQLLYPNILAFFLPVFLRRRETDFILECIRVYNDYQTEFCEADPSRLLPLSLLPYWDVDECIGEFERCLAMGHRGIVFAAHFDKIGVPDLGTGHWDPLLARVQESGMSVNFHVGFSQGDAEHVEGLHRTRAQHTQQSSGHFAGNARAIVDIITSGTCHRFPDLNFVSVESGAGWIPYLLESLDWHWCQFGARAENPTWELPSFYFKRQIYGAYWFERDIIARTADILADNIMFSTDFPHPTSLSPGPASIADLPSVAAAKSLAGVPREIARKILYENAARLYHID